MTPPNAAYLAADLDRRFALNNFPDHGTLLANLVRWAAGDSIPLQVQGPGLVACELYQQGPRLILHIINLTSAGTWRAPVHEFIAVGPLRFQIRLPASTPAPNSVRTRVANETLPFTLNNNWLNLELKSILDHELIIIE